MDITLADFHWQGELVECTWGPPKTRNHIPIYHPKSRIGNNDSGLEDFMTGADWMLSPPANHGLAMSSRVIASLGYNPSRRVIYQPLDHTKPYF